MLFITECSFTTEVTQDNLPLQELKDYFAVFLFIFSSIKIILFEFKVFFLDYNYTIYTYIYLQVSKNYLFYNLYYDKALPLNSCRLLYKTSKNE